MAKKTETSEAPTPPPAPPPTMEDLQGALAAASAEANALREQKDAAYRERNQVVAGFARCALALGFRAWLGRHPEEDAAWENDWRTIVYVHTTEGLLSWHVHDSEAAQFSFLPTAEQMGPNAIPYDGHTTEEKYRRLAAWRPVKRNQ